MGGAKSQILKCARKKNLRTENFGIQTTSPQKKGLTFPYPSKKVTLARRVRQEWEIVKWSWLIKKKWIKIQLNLSKRLFDSFIPRLI